MNLQKFIYLPLFTIIVSLPGQAKAHDNLWNGLIKKLHTDKILSMTAGLETRPVHKMYPKIISFKGIVEIPSVLHITKGDGATKTIAGQLIFDKQVICNYSPRSSKHQKLYYLEYCTDRYGANDEIYVQNKIELKLNFASSDSAILSTQIKVIRSDEVNYGIMFPYIEADIGQILMFNGDAWVPSDIEILEGKQGPQGERGEIGPQGPTGPQGIQGPSGPQGLQGERGIQGASGATGPIGPQGIPGLKGDKGDNGVPGEIGETGPMGPQGLQGPKGDKGEKGERGRSEIVVLKDEKPSGTNGGTCTKGLWIPKDLTTMSGDTGFVNLAGNKFTLQPGIYFIEASAPGFGIAHHQIKLKNIETGSDVLFGTTSISNNTSPGTTNSELMGQITLTASRTFEIQHRCAVDRVNTGFGMAAGFGTPEIYTQVKIIKKQ